jgi:hypothetical protein
MYRPLRQKRYEDLTLVGFTKAEARVLSKIPRSVPYLKDMVSDRYNEYKRFKKSGKTDAEFQTHILRRYNAKGWTRGKPKAPESVWSFLRDTGENPYKEKHPDYVRGYPKKSHHRDGGKTANKLQGGLLETYKQELKSYGSLENERTEALRDMIRRMESKGE